MVGIVEPKYYRPIGHTVTKWEKFKMNGKNPPVDTFAGTVWYILIMAIGIIFKARLMIWIVASLCYILWRFGYLGKK